MGLLVRDMVVVRDKFYHLGVVQREENVCSFCSASKEESQHIFVHCDRVYNVWIKVTRLWEMNFIGTGDVATNFDV